MRLWARHGGKGVGVHIELGIDEQVQRWRVLVIAAVRTRKRLMARAAAQLLQRGIDRDPMQPGREGGAAIELGERSPGLVEGLLRRVFGQRDVAGDPPAQLEHRPAVQLDQLAEGAGIATAGGIEYRGGVGAHAGLDARRGGLVSRLAALRRQRRPWRTGRAGVQAGSAAMRRAPDSVRSQRRAASLRTGHTDGHASGGRAPPAPVAKPLDPRPRLREDRLFAGMTNPDPAARTPGPRRRAETLSRNRTLATPRIVAPAKAGAQFRSASVAGPLEPHPRIREDRLFAGMTNPDPAARTPGPRRRADTLQRNTTLAATSVAVAPAKSLSSRRRGRGPRHASLRRERSGAPSPPSQGLALRGDDDSRLPQKGCTATSGREMLRPCDTPPPPARGIPRPSAACPAPALPVR